MSADLSELTLDELRDRCRRADERSERRLLRALRADRRAGARSLERGLERRVRERARVGRMFRIERELARSGVARIAGVDEVGMGPLAGPVVAAAVILPLDVRLAGLRDSKQLSATARDELDAEIRACALDLGIGVVPPAEIDRLNVYHAGLLAMRRASEALSTPPDYLLVDARQIPGVAVPQRAIVRGDTSVGSIAAASIIAKVWRDRGMRELDRAHPGYGFANNAGYGTAEHLRALQRQGPTPAHRRSFAPVAQAARSSGPACRTR